MNAATDMRLRYQPAWCRFVGRRVWAIVARQPDGSWRMVNCLDKEQDCFGLECAFTTDYGSWPYAEPASPRAEDA